MQCTDVQHSAFLTSASPSAHHINQKHWGTSNQPFRQLPHVHWSPLWGLGLKNTIQVPRAFQEVECLPVILLNIGSAVLEMDQAALQLIVSLCTVLVLVLTALPAFRAWPKVFHAECVPQGEILGRNTISSANSCGSVFLVEHMLFYHVQTEIQFIKLSCLPKPCSLGT